VARLRVQRHGHRHDMQQDGCRGTAAHGNANDPFERMGTVRAHCAAVNPVETGGLPAVR